MGFPDESIETQVHWMTYSIPDLTDLHAEIALRTVARMRKRTIHVLEDEEPEWPLRRKFRDRLSIQMNVPRGWGDLVWAMCEMLVDVTSDIKIAVPGPRYGRLIAVGSSMSAPIEMTNRIHDLTDAAADIADNICQTCGARGRFRRSPKGWFTIKCDEHADPGSWILFAPPGWRRR